MGTRNNPSPGGLRPGLEATNRRPRREPVRSKLANVASNAGDEVATRNDSNDEEPLAMSIEKQEKRPTKSTSSRRHNTRSTSRSVSPSLLNNGFTERKEDSKGKGHARSPSASSNQGVKVKGARAPKRSRAISEDEEDRDTVDEKPSKRVKSKIHKDHADRPVGEPLSRKRNLRNQIHDSPIPEVPEEEEFVDNRVKRTKPIPQHELQFSYAPILAKYPPQPSKQPSQPDEEPTLQLEPAPTRTPQSTSNELALVPARAEAEYPQQPGPTSSRTPQSNNNELALIPAPEEAEDSQRSDATPKLIDFAEQRAIRDAPTSSTPQQPVIGRTDAQSSDRRSGARDVVQQRSTPRNRSASSPPLPTLKHPKPSIRATANLNGSPVLRQGLMDTRVAQGSARKGRAELPSDSTARKANLHENYDKPRSRVRHPYTKVILKVDAMPVFEDSEHEDDSENEEVPKRVDMDEHKAWKHDLHVAKSTLVKVMRGQRLPDPGSSIDGMDPRITRRKPGETPKAPRQRENNIPVPTPPASNYLIIQGRFEDEHFVLTKVRNIDDLIEASKWSQERGNSLTEAIEFFEASKSRKTNRVRSAAPSPASQRGNSQPPSMSSFHRNPSTPREVPGTTRSASLQLSNGEVAVRRSEMDEAAEDDESTGSFDDYEEKNDNMSRNTSEVTADEATLILPTTPTMTPSQQASEPRAWSSVLTTVKKAVYTPFKFFGRTPNAAEAATTNLDKPEFTFSHSHKPALPLTTPSRSSKQHAMPHSERRGNTNNERRRVSFQARVPQTERQRRHVDRSTPLHLRGVPSARDMQNLHDQQASTRQRKRDEDMASLEENELSHGKTFRAPSPSSESDDEEDNATTMTDDNDEPTSPPRKTEYAFLPQTVQPAQKVRFEAESSANTGSAKTIDFSLTNPRPSLNFPTAAERRDAKEASITNPAIKRRFERNQVPSEDGDSPYYYVRADDQWQGQYYRKVHKTDPEEKFYNMFGTEAFWFRLADDVFVELNHNGEPGLRASGPIKPGFVRWSRWMEKPRNLEKEKKALLAKWAKVPNSQKPLLLPGIRPFYKKLMEIGEFAPAGPSSTGTASASGTSSNTLSGTSSAATSSGTATASGVSSNNFSCTTSAATSSGTPSASGMSSNPFSGTASASSVSSNIFSRTTSAATSGGTNSAANPSGTYKFPEDDETEGDGDDVEPDVADQAQFQTPPPKPRPGNAQLPQSQPQPTPARAALAAALANVNKHRPVAPSNLRNVTQMSPLQQPDQENLGVNGITTNETRNAKETISRAAVIQTEDELRKQAAAEEAVMTPEERTRQLNEVYRDLMAIPEDALPVFVLPKAPKMQWPEGNVDYDQDEVNAATEAAFEMHNGGY